MYMVVTTTGSRVFDNAGQGLDQMTAEAGARERNTRAKAMGLAVRYEAAEFVKAAK